MGQAHAEGGQEQGAEQMRRRRGQARANSPRERRVTTSAEKVEKVVRPPRKPVITRRRISGRPGWRLSQISRKPTRKPPSRLAVRVPSGTLGKTGFRR